MGIFDVFTGAPQKEAANLQRMLLMQQKQENNSAIGGALSRSLEDIGKGYLAGRDALKTGYDTGVGAVTSGFGGADQQLTDAADLARLKLGDARGNLDDSLGALTGLGAKYGQGTNLYLDALGVNGADGTARATAAFTPSLSYDFNLNQGLDAINRARNARGMANSGNTDQEAQMFGAGLASREMTGWMDRLAGLINPELTAETGRAGAFKSLADLDVRGADLETALGGSRAALETGKAGMLADLAKVYSGNVASNYQTEADRLGAFNMNAAGMQVGSNNQLAMPMAQTYKQAADAQTAGSANAWGAIMQGAKLATGALGGGFAPSSFGMNPSSAAFGSNPFTPSGAINPAYLT